MEREIKFQVLHQNKIIGMERLNGTQWEWQYFILNPDKGERWTSGVFGNSPNLIRRQYTGLKDKNEKEIYEGDIIQTLNNQNNPMNCEVYFDFAHAGFWQKHKFISGSSASGEIGHYLLKKDRICERWVIVGNIYENPELLNK